MSKSSNYSKATKVFAGIRVALLSVFLISGVVNILALTGAFYMLQIYDRALTSHSIPTLLAISVLAIGLYGFQGILDVIRSQVLVRLGALMDRRLSPLAHRVTVDMPRFGFGTSEALERGRDVDTVRNFLASQGPIALFDLPWMPLYLAFIYFLHPMLAFLAIGGALVLATLTLITELRTRSANKDAHLAGLERSAIADANARNSDVLKAMGFTRRAVERYSDANRRHSELQTKASDVGGTIGGLSRVLRMILQSAVLGLGAYLTIQGELTAGAIIAASVASARALAPVDMIIGQWKNCVAARRSLSRLHDTLKVLPDEVEIVELPDPSQKLTLENLSVAAPNTGAVLLGDVTLELEAGSALGVIGPSGSGKSTLAKAITGVWPALRGHVRLDGADICQWDEERLGPKMGYLPQEIQLFDGTIADNISRFQPEQDSGAIVHAAMAAGVHDLIVRLSEGYQTRIGPHGAELSAGQRQRIGLARALYGDPFLIVLDEPNSNLDAEGDRALSAAIQGVRERGGIVVVVSHRPNALAAVDKVAVIQDGRLKAFGDKSEVLRDTIRPAPNAAPAREVLRQTS